MSEEKLAWAMRGPPVGTWVTSGGTFDNVMNDTVTFAADGTGWVLTRSALRGEKLLPLMWRHTSPGELHIAVLEPGGDPSEEPYYERFRYSAVTVESDVGGPVAALQNDDDEVFWSLAGPVVLRSQTPEAPPES